MLSRAETEKHAFRSIDGPIAILSRRDSEMQLERRRVYRQERAGNKQVWNARPVAVASGRYVGQMKVTIRPAMSSDVAALSVLAKRSWADAFANGISSEDLAAELEDGRSEAYFADALARDDRMILIAETKGVLAGYAQFGDVEIPEVETRPGDQSIHRVYVDTELQGRGIGRRLSKAALEHPRLAHASRVFLQVWDENERAVGLYKSLGFKRIGTTQFTVGTEVMEDDVYVLDKNDGQPTAEAEEPQLADPAGKPKRLAKSSLRG
jgi:ribosomal protein S18 acetylase RimI-like enzyme